MEYQSSLLTLGRGLTAVLLFYVTLPIQADVAVPAAVKTFYSSMQKLSQTSDKNTAYYISEQMKACFYGVEQSVSGTLLPNDFRFFDYDKKNLSHSDVNLNSASYVDRLKNYIFQDKILKVSYRIIRSEESGQQPDFVNGRLSLQSTIVDTYVEKSYEILGFRKLYNDTVRTDNVSGKISEIHNGFGKTIVNITTLRNKAAVAYQRKRYKEAYSCYEQIISMAPSDANALFRIGLMTYFQYDDCGVPKKGRKAKAKAYLKKAELAARGNAIGDRAHNAWFWLERGANI